MKTFYIVAIVVVVSMIACNAAADKGNKSMEERLVVRASPMKCGATKKRRASFWFSFAVKDVVQGQWPDKVIGFEVFDHPHGYALLEALGVDRGRLIPGETESVPSKMQDRIFQLTLKPGRDPERWLLVDWKKTQ